MGKPIRKRKTARYSDEFKSKAVQLSMLEGVTVVSIAEALDIHPFMLSRWRKHYREGRIVVKKKNKLNELKHNEAELKQIQKLKEENNRLKQENDLLKKWHRFLGEIKERNSSSSLETEN